ncbi:hypothetical protein FAI40_04565 [Acetobacteraceae bacterium]|nr:hypothetical protein FAI40_04565 [Acetobacteraceae bacterium]
MPSPVQTYAIGFGIGALEDFIKDSIKGYVTDLSDFQKRIKQTQPFSEFQSVATSLNLNAQELYQTEQASLSKGGVAGEAVHFWQNLQKQVDTNPAEAERAAKHLGLEKFDKDGQGRVSGDTLQKFQDAYHAHKGDKTFEKKFSNGVRAGWYHARFWDL